ncbi:MAG: ROK family protein [Thermoanaerobaculales bacterium]|nr:ROK family protein [Thermoanaerobaculales bacterium]
MRETIIGVDLGGTKVSVGAVAGGEVHRVVRREVPAEEAAEVVLDAIADTIAEVFDSSVVGIGCGVPSVVDVERGVVFDVENIPSWKEVHLKAALEDRFGVPVSVNNDANAFVVGEYVFGKGRGFHNVVGMTLGTGLGTGVIVAGRLYSGANCGVGEIGMMAHKGLRLEEYCSGPFFVREYGVGGDVLFARASAGDPEALGAFNRYGLELSEAVMIALYAYDPDALVFGGSISAAFDFFEAGLRKGLDRFSYPRVIEGLVIDRSELENAAIFGAAALYVDAVT